MPKRIWLLVVLVIAACVRIPSLDPIENASKNVKAASEEIKKGMETLGKLDPLALNKLINENTDLRNAVTEAQSQLARLGTRVGRVEVSPTSRVFFLITGYSGQLRLDGYVNSANNPFLTNKLALQAEKRPAIDYGIAQRILEEKAKAVWCSRPFADCNAKPLHDIAWVFGDARFGEQCNRARFETDAAYKVEVERALTAYLASPFVPPSGELSGPQAIDRRLLREGPHTLYLRLIPEALDSTGHWNLEYKSYIQHLPDGQQEQIHSGRIDSKTSKWELNKPMDPMFAGSFDVVFVQGK
jgi:hypothetical protein